MNSCRTVENYKKLNRIAEGTYGVVYRAQCKQTGDIVALKKLKIEMEREGFPMTSMREIVTLMGLGSGCEGIVRVREIVVGKEMNSVFIVMEFIEHDLRSLMDDFLIKSSNYNNYKGFTLGEIKEVLRQLLVAINHLHSRWVVHRDLKSSNILLTNNGKIKVADFGLARRLGSRNDRLTPVVVTLWYRAPELLLAYEKGKEQEGPAKADAYTSAIDMWSIGCIFGELMVGKPLIPGTSEIDQVDRMFRLLGYPTNVHWPDVQDYPFYRYFSERNYPIKLGVDRNITKLRETLLGRGGLSEVGLDLLSRLLEFDPKKRISANEALDHDFFKEIPLPKDPSLFPSWPSTKGALEPKPNLNV